MVARWTALDIYRVRLARLIQRNEGVAGSLSTWCRVRLEVHLSGSPGKQSVCFSMHLSKSEEQHRGSALRTLRTKPYVLYVSVTGPSEGYLEVVYKLVGST